MKISFLINNMSHGGGTERVTSIIANELSRQHDVFILSCRGEGESKFILNESVELFFLCGDKYRNSILRKWIIVKELKKFIEKKKIDVIIFVDIDLCLYAIPLRSYFKVKEVKTIAWEHFNYYYHTGIKGFLVKLYATNYIDCLIVLGKRDLDNYRNKCRITNRLEYIYNPIAFSSETKSDMTKKNIIAVGRLEYQKGFDLLLQAWGIIEEEVKEWKLLIVGNGSKEKELKEYCIKNYIKKVEFIPFTDNIEDLYLKSSLFVLSSRFEGFVLAMLEAKAKGLPVVSFDCHEGPREMIKQDVNGLLIERENVLQFALGLKRVLTNDELRHKMAFNATDGLEKFEIKEVIKKWNKILDELKTK